MRIDAHQHFWRYSVTEYGWIGQGMERLMRDHLPADLWPLMRAACVDGTIAVQARQTLQETDWLLELAAQHAFVRGVVGWVDLRSPMVREQLARYAPSRGLCGVRHVVQDEPDDQFMLRPDFLRGIATLAEFDLAYDILIFPKHLRVACELVERFPDQRFVLDHIAKPPIRDGPLSPWDADIRRLAAHPNVYCKLSGMVTEANTAAWRAADLGPYLDVVVRAFGTERLMIGSDWPVCTLAGEYAEVLRIVQDYVWQFSAEEQAAILGVNAARFYHLQG